MEQLLASEPLLVAGWLGDDDPSKQTFIKPAALAEKTVVGHQQDNRVLALSQKRPRSLLSKVNGNRFFKEFLAPASGRTSSVVLIVNSGGFVSKLTSRFLSGDYWSPYQGPDQSAATKR